ncbi:ADP-ribose pyrophosphatase [Staphylococcus microti]|uniref:ADP-ribose pyrophosphatase n=1 Tax=Staphylococcus microti TaxID=569857 RepID=A0A0D6XUL9_9STAP|nr:NUDIX hydrolase [Staphylococcus microti]KIX91538.1 ADP-ribose pyrophosphatase [Staphylococcus microti]PNZ80887.1 NUDIX hydrolase [Staphylococcus microti]SUM57586.1 ADP-ribose pyrophosphatase [Staphylococcus microti]
MNFEEKTIEKESIYDGRIIRVEKHLVSLPNGNTAYREVVKHNGAVAICAVNPEGQVILVKQFRKPLEHELLEIPAGKLEIGEDREAAAKRELEEETGYRAKTLQHIGDIYGTPGFSNELISVYFTDDIEKGDMNLDADEFVEPILYSLSDVEEAVKTRKINDAKTLIAFQHLLLVYNHSK